MDSGESRFYYNNLRQIHGRHHLLATHIAVEYRRLEGRVSQTGLNGPNSNAGSVRP